MVMLRYIAAVLAVGATCSVNAAEMLLPDAGQTLRSQDGSVISEPLSQASPLTQPEAVETPLAEKGGARVSVQFFVVDGASKFPPETLEALLVDLHGQSLNLSEIKVAADRITQFYRARGFSLARTHFPAQKIDDGVVHLLVVEGRLGDVNIKNASRISDSKVQAYLDHAVQSGEVVSTEALERTLLVLSDITPIETATLKAGSTPGTTDFELALAPKSATARVSVDNYGSRYIGNSRAGIEFKLPGLLRVGDELSGNFKRSDEAMNYGRLSWRIPVGVNGLKLGASAAISDYHLAGGLESLQAHGVARTASLFTSYPVRRTSTGNLIATAKFEWKGLSDRIDALTAPDDAVNKHMQKWQLGLVTDGRDRWGYSRGGLNVAFNRLNIDSADDRLLDATTLHTQGSAVIGQLNLERYQMVAVNSKLVLRAEMQASNSNLDVSDKMFLGGAAKMRAYPLADAVGDDGWMASVEWQQSLGQYWDTGVFHEIGAAWLNHKPLANTQNLTHLQSSGLWLKAHAGAWDGQATLAWRTGGDREVTDFSRSPRIWVEVARSF